VLLFILIYVCIIALSDKKKMLCCQAVFLSWWTSTWKWSTEEKWLACVALYQYHQLCHQHGHPSHANETSEILKAICGAVLL